MTPSESAFASNLLVSGPGQAAGSRVSEIVTTSFWVRNGFLFQDVVVQPSPSASAAILAGVGDHGISVSIEDSVAMLGLAGAFAARRHEALVDLNAFLRILARGRCSAATSGQRFASSLTRALHSRQLISIPYLPALLGRLTFAYCNCLSDRALVDSLR
jgi:hypothetical protein